MLFFNGKNSENGKCNLIYFYFSCFCFEQNEQQQKLKTIFKTLSSSTSSPTALKITGKNVVNLT